MFLKLLKRTKIVLFFENILYYFLIDIGIIKYKQIKKNISIALLKNYISNINNYFLHFLLKGVNSSSRLKLGISFWYVLCFIFIFEDKFCLKFFILFLT